jgi:hypothetical protein
MSKTVQWKRGNANVSSTYTGPEGELTVNTTDWTLNIHDGATQGGRLVGASLGNLEVSNQTIVGTVSNANIVIDPDGTGIVVLNNGVTTDGNISASYFVGNGSLLTGTTNYGNANVAAYLPTYTGNLSVGNLLITDGFLITANSANNTSTMVTVANNDARISATNGTLNSTIYLWANNGRMSFNTVSNAFDFNFNGQLSATDFIASKSSSTGYSFYTPGEGLSGFVHVNGPPSYIKLTHDNIDYTKFYANYTTQTIGNLVISSNANVFGSFPNAFVQVYANINSYSQVVHQNLNSGPQASSDFVATANNGDDFTYFVGMGISSSTYNFTGFEVIKPNDAYLLVVGNDYLGPSTGNVGNLVLGSHNGNIKFYVGAAEDANVITVVGSTGLLPGANVTYNLGSATRQWKDLWLSNSTLYLGGFPVTVSNAGVLSVNGSPVTSSYGNANVSTLLAAFGSNTIVTTGNISSGNISTGRITLTNGAVIRDTAGDAVAIGQQAGETSQGNYAVAMGFQAAITSQGTGAVAIGREAGNAQGAYAVAIGQEAGFSGQGSGAIAIGLEAGETDQGEDSVAIGYRAGRENQDDNSVSIGTQAGQSSQGELAVAIGHLAGNASQGNAAVAIGASAGQNTQGVHAVAIGTDSGATTQGNRAVAIGYLAGSNAQGTAAVAIGYYAGELNQGNNSIIINATDTALQQTTANTFTVAPVRNDVANVAEVVFYNTTSKEITYGNTISVSGNIAGGNISTTGNVTATNFIGNGYTLSNVATQVTGSWTVPAGNSTQSFTVSSGTYSMWVDCNIPNGILVWNATVTVTNTNVPVVGAQYAWVYNGGGTPIDFTSIPNQFTGTANTIVRSNVAPSSTTNRFDFGINNTSGNAVIVRYGYTKIS